MIRLNEETGSFLLSFYGSALALGFKGDAAFIERSYNWASNHGVTKGRLHRYLGDCFGYVLLKSRESILKALTTQFRGEIIRDKEIPLLKDEWTDDEIIVEFDDVKIDALAAVRAQRFYNEKITPDNFLARAQTKAVNTYQIHPIRERVLQNSA